MKKTMIWVLGSLLTGGLSAFAAAPVAMRVEVEPLRQSGDNTLVAVVIQVSPEDRGRVGLNAIVRIELDGGRVSSGSPMRAVRFEDDGSARVEIEWPPGQHDLRVTLEDSSRENTGIWVGKVRIPDLSPHAESMEMTESKPMPAPEPTPPKLPVPETVDTAVAATSVQGTKDDMAKEAQPESEVMKEEPSMKTEQAVPTAVAAVPESEPPTGPPVEVAVEIEKPDVAEEAPEPKVEVEIAADDVEPPTVDDVAEVEEESAVEDVPEFEEELPIVEPLRSDPAPGTTTPKEILPAEPGRPETVAAPLSAEMMARYGEWGRAESGTREFSLTAMRGRDPAVDLDKDALRLRVGGKTVPIDKLGDAESAPLLLGLAIDVASGEIDGWSGARGSLGSLAERAGSGRGRVFVSTSSGVGPWGDQPMPPEGRASAPLSNNVAQLVISSLEQFSGQLGRTFLVVLTDGRNEPSKGEWNEASEAAAEAGVPILVIALWDDEFNHRTRKSLKQLTDTSGGSLFLVQGSNQLDSAADRFGRLLDGSYALRFKSSSDPKGKATSIAVNASEKGVEVSAPKSIR